MKHLTPILILFALILHLSAFAAVPLRWTVETSLAKPATFEAFQGETLDFEATLQSYGKPLEAPSNYALYWQTNGMGSAYWSMSCTNNQQLTTNNLLRATWLPSYDVGARAYNCFIGLSNSIYHAAFQLRLRPSPGAVPNELPLPQKVIDFSQVTVLNPPWSGGGSGGVDTNAVIDIAREEIVPATNDLNTALNGAIADTVRAATNDLNTALNDAISSKRDLTNFDVTEPKNIHWTWTSNDPGLPDGWLEKANAYGAPKPERVYVPIDGWYCNNIDGKFCTSPVFGADSDLSVSLSFSPGKDGLSAFNVVATRSSATDTTPVKVNSLSLVSQLPTASQLLTPAQAAEIAKVQDKRDKTDLSVYGWIEAENTNWVWYAWSLNVPAGFVERMNAEAVIPRYDTMWHVIYSDGEYVCDDWVHGSDYDGDDESLAKKVFANFYLHGEFDEENFYVVAKRSSAFVKSLMATNSLATTDDLTTAISTNNPAFVSAVQSISPPSPPSLRLYDAVRDCYWIGHMVNGIISWEVEE